MATFGSGGSFLLVNDGWLRYTGSVTVAIRGAQLINLNLGLALWTA